MTVIAPDVGMRCRKCGKYKPGKIQELMQRLLAGDSLTTEELVALQRSDDDVTCSCTQIYAFIPHAINWSCSSPRGW